MWAPRIAVASTLVFTAIILELSVLSRLPLPVATPDLVLLVVVALGLAWGPLPGSVVGFCSGLALDLVPPADHTIGRWALVLSAVGYLAGLAQDAVERSAFLPVLVVAVLAAGAGVLYAATGALIGDPRVDWQRVVQVVPTAVLYDVLLSPFVVFAVFRLAHRVEPETTHT